MQKIIFKLRESINGCLILSRRNIIYALIMLGITIVTSLAITEKMNSKTLNLLFAVMFLLSVVQALEIKNTENIRKVFGISLLIISPAVMFHGMEYINDNNIFEMYFLNVVLNYMIYLSVYLVIYLLFNRISVAIIIGSFMFFVYIVLNTFVYQYRGNPIRAYDILAMRTAMSVADEYELSLTYEHTVLMLCVFVLCFLALKVKWHERNWKRRGIVSIFLFMAVTVSAIPWLSKEFITDKGLRPDWWQIDASAKEHGMLWDLVAGIPYLKVEKPRGYSSQKAEAILEKEESFEEAAIAEDIQQPDIIAIMNESFSDIGILGELETNKEYMNFFNSLSENTVRGNAYVPIRGGLTSNSEFEFITGFSCAFLPGGTIAYQTVIREGTYNLGNELKNTGYHTTFMHPYFANGWNRNSVYKNFKFDQALFLEDLIFDNEDYLRSYISDEANYEKIIECYENQKTEGKSTFLFNVTMQNHGGYGWGMNEIQVQKPVQNDAESAEYLSLIKESDVAFEKLLEYFSSVKTPTIILLFGDHQPALPNLTSVLQDGSSAEDIEAKMEEYCIPFVIWANYDIEEKSYDGISLNFLQTVLMETAGLPLNEYQAYLKEVMLQYPIITSMGVKDSEGKWYRFEEAKEFGKISEYSWIQYWKLIENAG